MQPELDTASRAFLGRAVRYLAGPAGIGQFLDIGAGPPGAGSVHEVAQAVAPRARVVCVDNDPAVLTCARTLLASTASPAGGQTAYFQADLRDPEKILASPVVAGTLDLTQPVALILAAVLPCLTDADDPAQVVATLLGALVPGSYLVASHVTPAALDFGGLDLVDPGLVPVSQWRPPPDAGPRPAESNWYGAVARKPDHEPGR